MSQAQQIEMLQGLLDRVAKNRNASRDKSRLKVPVHLSQQASKASSAPPTRPKAVLIEPSTSLLDMGAHVPFESYGELPEAIPDTFLRLLGKSLSLRPR